MSANGNGNGKPPHENSALEDVEMRIAAQQHASETTLETLHVGFATDPAPSMVEEASSMDDPDPLSSWKRREAGKPITLEQVHAGMIATCEYSKAAIEGSIKMAADIREVVEAVDVRSQQITTLTAKVESTSRFVHKVDEETGRTAKMLDGVRRDVQFIKDDVREIKVSSSEAARQLPAIKEMLGEILARLPDPGQGSGK